MDRKDILLKACHKLKDINASQIQNRLAKSAQHRLHTDAGRASPRPAGIQPRKRVLLCGFYLPNPPRAGKASRWALLLIKWKRLLCFGC